MSALNDPGRGPSPWTAGRIRPHTAGIYPHDMAFLDKVFGDRSTILGRGPTDGYKLIYSYYAEAVLTLQVTPSVLGHAENALDFYEGLANTLKVPTELQLHPPAALALGLKVWPPIDDFRDYFQAERSRRVACLGFINGFIHFRKSEEVTLHRIYLNVHPENVSGVMDYLLTHFYHPQSGVRGVRNVKCASIGLDRSDTIVIYSSGSGATRLRVLNVIREYQTANGRRCQAHFRHIRPPLTMTVPGLIGVSEAMEPPGVTHMDASTGDFQLHGTTEQQSFGSFNAQIIFTALKTAGEDEGLFVTLVRQRLADVGMPAPRAPQLTIGDYDRMGSIRLAQTQFVVGALPKPSFLSQVKDPYFG